MDLKLLIKEIDYQREYSYDKRADFLNKYAISTAQKYFNPIYELAKFILSDRHISSYSTNTDNIDYGSYGACYSHSGAVMSSFNKQEKTPQNKNASVRLYNNDTVIIIYGSFYDKSEYVLKPILSFNLENKLFCVRNACRDITIKRNIYDLIDEWLIDFGYEKW